MSATRAPRHVHKALDAMHTHAHTEYRGRPVRIVGVRAGGLATVLSSGSGLPFRVDTSEIEVLE